jgi:hypothetical protein
VTVGELLDPAGPDYWLRAGQQDLSLCNAQKALSLRPYLGHSRRMVWAGSLISSCVGADECPMDFIPASYSTAPFQKEFYMGAAGDRCSPDICIGALMARAYKPEDALHP